MATDADSVSSIFSTSPFYAHGYCLSWDPRLLGLHVFSDAVIAFSYYSIPFAIAYFAVKRTDLRHRWLVWLGAAFILLCGTTHLIGAVTIWEPIYLTEGWVKAVTAGVSFVTAVALWPMLPRALALPSPTALAAANAEINALNADLERRVAARTAELEAANTRLREEVARRERAQAELIEARTQAEHASRAKSDFLAHMSHELRTPLNVILAYSEVISEETLGPGARGRYRDYARDIHVSGTHLLGIIGDVLDLSRIEAGAFELREEDIDPADLAEKAVRMAKFRPDGQDARIEIDLPGPRPSLRADPRVVTQAVVNLLTNAMKYGGTELPPALRLARSPDGGIDIAVIDRGPGMSAAQIEVALTPFHRLDGHAGRAQDGVGLGLPLCARFMEKHGGRLILESAPGEGTRAILRFPPDRVMA